MERSTADHQAADSGGKLKVFAPYSGQKHFVEIDLAPAAFQPESSQHSTILELAAVAPNSMAVIGPACFFSVCSVGMLLVNKCASGSSFNSVLMLGQNLGACLLALVISYLSPSFRFSPSMSKFVTWAPQVVLIVCTIVSSAVVPAIMNVPNFSVLQNSSSLVVAVLEYFTLKKTISEYQSAFLALSVIGAAVYGWGNLQSSARGCFFSALHVVITSMSAVVVKKLNVQFSSSLEMSFYNNVGSLPLLFIFAAYEYHASSSQSIIQNQQCAAASVLAAFFISLSALISQKLLSATSWMALNNFNNILVLLLSQVISSDTYTVSQACGLATSVVASAGYTLSSSISTSNTFRCLDCFKQRRLFMIKKPFFIPLFFMTLLLFAVETGYRVESPLHVTLSRSNSIGHDNYPRGHKWAVILAHAPQTPVIQTLVAMHDWCVVVVPDGTSRAEAEFTRQFALAKCFVYLSVEKQVKLSYSILQFIEGSSFARKNIGFLFAMQHGAKVIYDTDNSNAIMDIEMLRYWSDTSSTNFEDSVRWRAGCSNPLPSFFGSRVSYWPRGLPLDKRYEEREYSVETVKPEKSFKKCIIQSLADHSPDMDALNSLVSARYPIHSVSESRFTVNLVKGYCMAPFNAQATLFFEEAFESLLLPVSVHPRVSDIWRGYIAQASVVRDDCMLIFTAPWVTQIRNQQGLLKDLEAENPLYQISGEVVEVLSNITKTSLLNATVALYAHNILNVVDVKLRVAWEHDIKMIKAQPARLTHSLSFPIKRRFRHLLIAMGKGFQLRNLIKNIIHSEDEALGHTDIIAGVYDEPVHDLLCNSSNSTHDLLCNSTRLECISVAQVSWTVGRNMLIKTAFKYERKQTAIYDFWTVMDADIELRCSHSSKDEFEAPQQNQTHCFSMYDAFLRALPLEVMAAHINRYSGPVTYILETVRIRTQAFDAAFNSFRREAVPLLFPYRSDLDTNSWHSSQVIFWFRVQCLDPYFAATPMYIYLDNNGHGPYPRNQRDRPAELRVAENHMGALSGHLPSASYEQDFYEVPEYRKLPWSLTINTTETLLVSKYFHQCAIEFTTGFFSFIHKK